MLNKNNAAQTRLIKSTSQMLVPLKEPLSLNTEGLSPEELKLQITQCRQEYRQLLQKRDKESNSQNKSVFLQLVQEQEKKKTIKSVING
jgi:hypothetical protein